MSCDHPLCIRIQANLPTDGTFDVVGLHVHGELGVDDLDNMLNMAVRGLKSRAAWEAATK
jgi:hypothetical protein